MPVEIDNERSICCRCATAYGRKKGNFPVSYAALYKGGGYLPYCRQCVDTMFNAYMKDCKDQKKAVRQMCRKLDLYWSETLYERVDKKAPSRSIMTAYIQSTNNIAYAGKCYDDTLKEEGALWGAPEKVPEKEPEPSVPEQKVIVEELEPIVITEDVVSFWGPGYPAEMYQELERRRKYWIENLPDGVTPDVGMNALIRQICNLEIDINRDRAAGKAVDKSVNMLNTLVGSMNLKPTQKLEPAADSSAEKTPFGVWIKRWEDQRPVPEVDESLKDVDGIVKYILTWVYGHMAHMLKIKNAHSPLYDEAVARLRVERPEYDEDDDDTMLAGLFGDGDKDGGG